MWKLGQKVMDELQMQQCIFKSFFTNLYEYVYN